MGALVLLEIKRHLYDPLDALGSWHEDTKSDICRTWNGVSCNAHDRVVRLELTDSELEGSLQGDFSQMEFLQKLSLERNKLHGTLPMLLENRYLEVAQLGGNFFDGPFLFSNPLSWTSPLSRSLIQLGLQDNQLSGSIGGGPASYFRHSVLERLDLGNNNLTGLLPQGFEGLYCLLYLNLRDNVYLEGPVPSGWSYFRHLNTLILTNDRSICGGREYIEHIHHLDIRNSGLENGCGIWTVPSPSIEIPTPTPPPSLVPPPVELPSPSVSPSPVLSPPILSPSPPVSTTKPPLLPIKPKIPIIPIIPVIPIFKDDDDDEEGGGEKDENPTPRFDLPNDNDVNQVAPQTPPETPIPISTASPSTISPKLSPSSVPSPSPTSTPIPSPTPAPVTSPSPSAENRTTKVTPFIQPAPVEETKEPVPTKIRKLDSKVVTPVAAGVVFILGLSTLAYYFLPAASAAVAAPSVFNVRMNPLAV